MRKFKVHWYIGSVTNMWCIIKSQTVEAEDISKVKFLDILPKKEKEKFAVNIKYCVRVIYLVEDVIRSVDYGSHSRFIWIEEIPPKYKDVKNEILYK